MIRYAGFWIRVLAAIIDTVFLLALILPPLLLDCHGAPRPLPNRIAMLMHTHASI